MATRRKRNYTVRTGDTAATIAKQLGIDPQTLMQANTGVGNLRPGMVLKTPSVYPLDKMGGVMAQGGGETPYPPAPTPAWNPPPTPFSYQYGDMNQAAQPGDWQTAVRGTNYQTYTVADQVAMGYSDEVMQSVGLVKYGNIWMRERAPTPGAAGGGSLSAGAIPWQQRGAPVGRIEDMGGYPGQREFYVERESSMPGQTYMSKERYDAYGNRSSFAPAVDRYNTAGLQGVGTTAVQGGQGGGHLPGTYRRQQARGKREKRWVEDHSYRGGHWEYSDSDDGGGGGGAVGRAAANYNNYGGYNQQGSYMPSVKQYARPNYLGLINWRI